MLGRIIEKAVGRSRLYARRLLARFPMFRSPTLPAARWSPGTIRYRRRGSGLFRGWRGTRAVIRSTPRPDSSDFDSYRVDRDLVGSVAAKPGKAAKGGYSAAKNFISLLGRRPADRIVGVTPMNNVGTWLGRSVAARCAPDPGEHLRRRHCQSPSPECAHHGQMRCDRRFRHPIPGKSRPHPGRVVGEKPWTCRRVEHSWWYCDQCACSPSGILSARAKDAGGGRDSIASEAICSG